MKITIDTHFASREEVEELKNYLENNCWDFKVEEKEIVESPLYILSDNSINGIEINEKINDEELFEYRILDRLDFIEELIQWISEAKSTDKDLMREDLRYLMSLEDKFIFSSISTNDYVSKNDSNFNELCNELLELNNTVI
jgi:hypothetical protein